MNPLVMVKAAGIVKDKLQSGKKKSKEDEDKKPTLLTSKGRAIQGPPTKVNYET